MNRERSSKNRHTAMKAGLNKYEGEIHAKCGTRLKYVNRHRCVHCSLKCWSDYYENLYAEANPPTPA